MSDQTDRPRPLSTPTDLPQDVTVRIPVQFESVAEFAGWMQATVAYGMEANNWVGEPFLIFRLETGELVGFDKGFVQPYEGVLPHGLEEKE